MFGLLRADGRLRHPHLRRIVAHRSLALAAAFTFAASAQAAATTSRLDVCAALRNGTSLGAIESTLEARGYSPSNAGVLTGIAIRQQCLDQAANAKPNCTRQVHESPRAPA
jgi:hypothetical protein